MRTKTMTHGSSGAPTLRVTGADESYLLAEDLFGLGSPIQYVWVFDDDPGEEAIDDLRRAIARGALHRAVVRTRVPAARHRWVRSTFDPPTEVAAEIDEDAVGSWADERVRAARLRPADGTGWRIESALTPSGRRVMSLTISHMISDGHGIYRALAAAAEGSDVALPDPVRPNDRRVLREDLADAAGQLRAAVRSSRILLRESMVQWRNKRRATPTAANGGTGAGSSSAPVGAPAVVALDAPGPEMTLAIVDIDRADWNTRAREHGGTANSLFTAVLAGMVRRSELTLAGPLRVCIAVSTRDGDGDDRANASGGVWIRLSDPVGPDDGLADIRALSKKAFTDYAASGADLVTNNLQPVVRLLPRKVIGAMMRSVPGPDTTVSNLGVVPDHVLCVGAARATSFAVRALVSDMPIQDRRARGPAVAAWAVEYDDRITLTFFGIHPEAFGDPELLRKLIGEELTAWQIGHRFW